LIQEYQNIETIYLNTADPAESLKGQIRKLYSGILLYQAKAGRHLERNLFLRTARQTFKLDDWDDMIKAVNTQNSLCRDILGTMDSALLRRFEKEQSVRAQKLDSLVTKQLEEFQEYVINMTKELITNREDNRDIHLTEEMNKCLQCFRTSNYEGHKNQNPEAAPNTCLWVLDNPKYKKWLGATTDDILWVSADPGCGKSVLSRRLADQPRTDVTFAYFFFKDGLEDQVSATKALSALLHQILSQKKTLIKHALPAYRENGQRLPELLDVLWKVLIAICSDPDAGEVCCLLDALDECKDVEKRRLIDLLNSYYRYTSSAPQDSSTRLKFLVTSRPYHDIYHGFQNVLHLSGVDESETIKTEIDSVIGLRVQEFSVKLHLKDEDHLEFEKALLSTENRTYLWLHLIFQDLENRVGLHRWKTLKPYLEQLPKSVADAYEKILNRCPDIAKTRRLLHLILGAKRPLNTGEMNIALNITGVKHCRELDLDPTELFEKDLRYMSGLFLSIVDSKVYLIHQTAREFLVATQDANDVKSLETWKHAFFVQETNRVLADICVTILNLNHLDDCQRLFNDKDANSKSEQHNTDDVHGSIRNYAVEHWGKHYKDGDIDDACSVYLASCEICDIRSKKYLQWTTGLDYSGASELAIRSAFGHTHRAEIILHGPEIDINAADSDGWTALHWAALNGHSEVVKLLLAQADIDVNAADSDGRTALYWAARNSHSEVVKLLLAQAEIDVNAADINNEAT
jgi:hypothetical protein